MKKETKKDGFYYLELVFEIAGWVLIVLSPALIGAAIGAFIYMGNQTIDKLIIGIFLTFVGLVLGIVLANKQCEGKGTIHFLSRVSATPDLDKQTEEEIEK
ncbi:MAG: hypothetical protein R3A43_13365 [Bacteroidia bacterium]